MENLDKLKSLIRRLVAGERVGMEIRRVVREDNITESELKATLQAFGVGKTDPLFSSVLNTVRQSDNEVTFSNVFSKYVER